MEWISPVAFRFARSWGGPIGALPNITHRPHRAGIRRSRVNDHDAHEVSDGRARSHDLKLQVKSGETPVASIALSEGPNCAWG